MWWDRDNAASDQTRGSQSQGRALSLTPLAGSEHRWAAKCFIKQVGNGFPTQSQVKKEGEESKARWGQWKPPSGDKGADMD